MRSNLPVHLRFMLKQDCSLAVFSEGKHGSGLVYEIYPRSFRDSNGDGNLNGIAEKPGYVARLRWGLARLAR